MNYKSSLPSNSAEMVERSAVPTSGFSSSPASPFRNRVLSGRRSSLLVVALTLVACILLIHVYSIASSNSNADVIQIQTAQLFINKELEHVEEEEKISIPRESRQQHFHSKTQKRKRPSIIEEYLDKTSIIRKRFFPDQRSAIQPFEASPNSSLYFRPGRMWLDTDGNPIQAHGGGLLYVESLGTYYWYGENKDGETYHAHKGSTPRVDIVGVSCYSSKDLWTWKNEGIVLQREDNDVKHDLHKSNVLERPKVIYNSVMKQYVMWMHIDNVNYTKASVGVAFSNWPTGPFGYLYSKQPHGFESRDMTVFKDDDGKAYLIYSSEGNSELHISPLTHDYLDILPVVQKVLVGQHREAPALFKHQGTYYMITSGCTGWAPNAALAHAAESIMGPWETLGNPCVGGNHAYRVTTFFSQSTFVMPLPGLPGLFIFMADRWNHHDLRDSRYVWLPLRVGGAADEPLEYSFGFPVWSRVSIYWHRKWKLPDGWNNMHRNEHD